MSTDDIFTYAMAVFRLALWAWGGTAIAAFMLAYTLAALSGAGESGSGEEEDES
jgi:hypothetical protein